MNQANYYSIIDAVLSKSSAESCPESVDSNYWHAQPGEAKESPYEPTGFAKLDQLVEAVKPCIRYGGDAASNDVLLAILFDHHRDLINDTFHYINMPHAADFESPEKYAAVLSHELTHWATIRDPEQPLTGIGEGEATNGMGGNGRLPVSYVEDEMSADMGAVLIMRWAGVPFDDREFANRLYAMASHVPADDRSAIIDKAKRKGVHEFVALLDRAGLQS